VHKENLPPNALGGDIKKMQIIFHPMFIIEWKTKQSKFEWNQRGRIESNSQEEGDQKEDHHIYYKQPLLNDFLLWYKLFRNSNFLKLFEDIVFFFKIYVKNGPILYKLYICDRVKGWSWFFLC
jgi:hypothetical protein